MRVTVSFKLCGRWEAIGTSKYSPAQTISFLFNLIKREKNKKGFLIINYRNIEKAFNNRPKMLLIRIFLELMNT